MVRLEAIRNRTSWCAAKAAALDSRLSTASRMLRAQLATTVPSVVSREPLGSRSNIRIRSSRSKRLIRALAAG